ncbi:MAG TPA: hypothetical protein VGE74_16350 [Gemmata sp.]
MAAGTVPPSAVPQPAPRASRRKRWLKRVLPLGTLLLCALWFAPAIVAKTELRNRFARQALADVRGSVEVGGASLGWFSPVELRDVTIKDEAGHTVASVPKITSQKSLAELARSQADPGTFTIENPTLTVACDKGTTNVEGTFAEYLKENPAPAPTRTPVNLKVTGGTLTIVDAATGKGASVEGIDATVTIPASRAEPVAVQLTAATGGLNVEASIGDASTAKIVSTDLALDTFAPLLKRADPGLTLAGALSTDVRLSWGTSAKGQLAVAVAGSAGGKQLALSAPWLNGDQLALDSVELPLDLELTGRTLRVRTFELKCDAGTMSVKGTFDPEDAAESVLMQPGLSVSANVEVAKLVAKLPKLLRLKEGTELREGRIELKLVSTTDPAGGTLWDGTVNTSALRGTRDGKPIAWEQPLRAEFLGKYEPGRFPTFKKFVCTADFISVNAASEPDTLLISTNIFLDKLGARLRDFIDLEGWTLDGGAFASFAGTRRADGRFVAEVVVKLTDFAFVDQKKKGLHERALELRLDAAGALADNGPTRLTTATAKLSANGDELDFVLTAPVANIRELSSGSGDVHLTGQLASWKARIGGVVTLPEFALTGTVDARGKAKFARDRVTVDRLTVALTKPKLERWIALDEPSVSAVGDLVFTRANRTAALTKLAITSETLKVANGTLAFEFPATGDPVVSGNGQCTADLSRLGRMVKLYADPGGPDALSGTGVGPLKFRTNGDLTTFSGGLAVANFGYGPKEQLVWFEPTLQLDAEGKYEDAADALTLTAARAERPGFAVAAKGTLGKLSTTRDVSLSGTLRYDWEKLTPLVQKFAGNTFRATGTGTRGFLLSGQLEPAGAAVATAPPPKGTGGPGAFAALQGEAALGWHALSAYGFDVGTGELNAKMTRGVVSIARLDATFGGGTVALTPTLDLSTDPGWLTFAKAPVVAKAKLTPAATASALGYALPAIANAAQAEGEISAAIDENRISLGDINRTTAKGVLVIHKATVGLNPVAAQVANLLGAKATTMTLANESVVPVQIANGRVYHQNFALRISGTTFHTSGSVGFDDTLDLTVDVPLPKDLGLLKNNPVLQKAVAGKVLKVPLKGTLSKPELDPKALNNALVALAREGAKDASKDFIESELKKLFPGMPGPNSKGGLPFTLPFGKKP